MSGKAGVPWGKRWKYASAEEAAAGQRAQINKWRADHPDRARIAWRRQQMKKYGMTNADYDLMVRLQGGRCLICDNGRPLSVDHDHVTGRVRGLICQGCNMKLAWLERFMPQLEYHLNVRLVKNPGHIR